MKQDVVYFAHGKESGPLGTKITYLAEIARKHSCQVESPDYSSTMDADQRVKMLLALKPKAKRHLILVGSSMGGYVSTVASSVLKPSGLFLMAPAFYIPGYKEQSPKPDARNIAIVHGTNDTVVPLDNSVRFAREHHVALHIMESDHRLTDVLSEIGQLFSVFLERTLQD